jgi:Ca2+-binding EF-hand superfamily protein
MRGAETERAQRFQAWDRNHDGIIQGNEWRAPEELFHQMDFDRNSVLSRDEFLGRAVTAEHPVTSADREMPFEQLDHNNDGVLTSTEWHGGRSGFQQLDRNRDNVVSRSEYGSTTSGSVFGSSGADREMQFSDVDYNRDGYISSSEWSGTVQEFRRMDRDGDNRITTGEFAAYGTAGEEEFLRRFRGLDNNNDGYVSRQEWRGNSRAFDRIDTNNDGFVSRDEFAARSRRR